MIYNKSEYRLNELSKRLKNETSKEKRIKLEIAIQKVLKKKEDWYVKFRNPFGKWKVEKVPSLYRGKRGAETYERKMRNHVSEGTFIAADNRKATLEDVCDYYLENKMKMKSSFSASKTLCNHIKRHLGSITLSKLDTAPEILVNHFGDFPEDWAQKYIWNYWTTLRAAINYWIRMKKLHLANPAELVEIDKDTRVLDYVPTDEDFDSIIVTSYTVGLPDFVRHIYTAVYETGLRIGEILSWRIEDLELRAPIFEHSGQPTHIPNFLTTISKQGRPTKVRLPMSRPLRDALVKQVGERSSGKVWKVEQSKLYKLLLEANLLKEAGVKFERPFHDFRKTVKTRIKFTKRLGKDVSKNFMGHRTDSMDEYYTHSKMFDLWCAVEDSWREKK